MPSTRFDEVYLKLAFHEPGYNFVYFCHDYPADFSYIEYLARCVERRHGLPITKHRNTLSEIYDQLLDPVSRQISRRWPALQVPEKELVPYTVYDYTVSVFNMYPKSLLAKYAPEYFYHWTQERHLIAIANVVVGRISSLLRYAEPVLRDGQVPIVMRILLGFAQDQEALLHQPSRVLRVSDLVNDEDEESEDEDYHQIIRYMGYP